MDYDAPIDSSKFTVEVNKSADEVRKIRPNPIRL